MSSYNADRNIQHTLSHSENPYSTKVTSGDYKHMHMFLRMCMCLHVCSGTYQPYWFFFIIQTTPNPTHKMEEAASQSLEEDFEGQATHTGN